MKIISCGNSAPSSTLSKNTSEICSRHVLAFGKSIQQKISSLIIGVISTGGLGSIIIEQLMRLFPKKLIFVDIDRVELSNLNRLVAATIVDAKLKTSKTDLACRNILEFNPDQKVLPIHGDFLERKNQKKFTECDFIFGASDSNAVRIAANRLCLTHGIPYLDCGVGAVVDDGILQACGGQVIKILPDSGFCLHCSEMFSTEHAMDELLSDEERERQEQQGYIRGTLVTAPQVYSLNMTVASQAVWLFMRMIIGEAIDFDGIAVDAKDFISYTWKESTKISNDCPTCGKEGIVFAGDDADLLCKDEPEIDVEGIGMHISTTEEGTQKVAAVVERELPIHSYLNLIFGQDMGNRFDFWM